MATLGEARALLQEATVLAKDGQVKEAMTLYRQAYDLLPDAPQTRDDRNTAREGYALYATHYARMLASQGRIAEARGYVEDVLREDLYPHYAAAKKLAKQLDDPAAFPIASTEVHRENVESVAKLLAMARSATEVGRWDEAESLFMDVLRVDSYNTAARRGMEIIAKHRMAYHSAARDQTRAKMLDEVSAIWEMDVPAKIGALEGPGTLLPANSDGSVTVDVKMRSIVIPNISFAETTLAEAVEFIKRKTKELDTLEPDPTKKGVNIIIQPGPQAPPPVNLSLENVPLGELLRYVAEASGMAVKVEQYGIRLVSGVPDPSASMIVRTFRVPPTFLTSVSTDDAANDNNPFGGGGGLPGAAFSGLKMKRLSARDVLEKYGVTFPEGSNATYRDGVLLVRNTVENLDLIDTITRQMSEQQPKQIAVYVKMIDIRQDNLKELGFDWLLGPFAIGSSGASGAGGTFNAATMSATANDLPFGVNGSPLTAGNRGASSLSEGAALDELVGGGQFSNATILRSPGIFSIGGVFTQPQFQMVIRGLDQKKGADLLAVPSVVVRPGQRATIDIVREFPYPIEFEPPEVPQNFGNVNGNNNNIIPPIIPGLPGVPPLVNQPQAGGFPITPTTPTAFDVRNTGISLEVEPNLGPDGITVDLTLSPSSVIFEGFINYGSPITSGEVELTPNNIPQPIFRVNRVTTSVQVYDGQTVMMGGLVSDTSRMFDDKTPILGDLPLIGRLFQNKANKRTQRHVVFFVTVKILDPSGKPVRPEGNPGADLRWPEPPAPAPQPAPLPYPSK
jgi:general secretion pathway protein D